MVGQMTLSVTFHSTEAILIKRVNRTVILGIEGRGMGEIELQSIGKSYGETLALCDINLTIHDGEFLTLVGPSGCGKSTLLRIIAGLEEQSRGKVLIDGKDVNRVRACNRDLAMVFQSYALYPHLTVWQNMITPLRLRDLSSLERFPVLGRFVPGQREKMKKLENLAHETAATLKLDRLLDRKPGQLSGGQRQRVALGRAMVRKPKAFLMDEPLSNLDAALRVHMRAELAELHRNLNTTFIYVTHDQAEALTMSDRIAIMIDGEIIQLGTPDEIYKNPRDRRVAEFVGSPKINILSGDVDEGGNVLIMGNHTGIRISKKLTRVHLGIRPEHFRLANGNGARDSWPFRVTYKENLGSDFYLHGHLSDMQDKVITRVTPDEVGKISIGETVKVKARKGKPMVFCDNDCRVDTAQGVGYGNA